MNLSMPTNTFNSLKAVTETDVKSQPVEMKKNSWIASPLHVSSKAISNLAQAVNVEIVAVMKPGLDSRYVVSKCGMKRKSIVTPQGKLCQNCPVWSRLIKAITAFFH